jgi:3-hydroxyacyl-CoA dehydrogenase/enoyl-CoA hydratase/carnithine racemase
MVTAVIDFGPDGGSSDRSSSRKNPLNPFSRSVRSYLLERLQDAIKDPGVTSIVVTGGRHNFSSGADLTEFLALGTSENSSRKGTREKENPLLISPSLLDIIDALDRSSKPVVAAISGLALGGGMEVALTCHYRVATSSGKLGLPEVNVGLIPGAGGTQRLPRCVGLEKSIRMILTGQPVSAKLALEMGLIDHVVENGQNNSAYDDLMAVALKWASFAEVAPLESRRLSLRRVPKLYPAEAHAMLHVAALTLPRQGSVCQRAALEAIRASVFALSFEEGMKVESREFLQLLSHPEGMARRHAFFATRSAQRPVLSDRPGEVSRHSSREMSWLVSQNASDRSRAQVGVIGAGTMGSGIATVLLLAGYTVWLTDASSQALEKGLSVVRKSIESAVKRRNILPDRAKVLIEGHLRSCRGLADLSGCQLVVEAIVESLKIKRKIFADLSHICSPTALLLSNTSTLSIDSIADAVEPPATRGMVAGWHFFSPAHVMKLVEIVRGQHTSVETVAALQVVSKIIGKISVVVGNCDGFCGNRLLKPYSAETALLLAEGAEIAQVDRALGPEHFGMALGPFQMSDLAGNDVGYNIRRERGWVRMAAGDDKSPPPASRPERYTEIPDEMVSALGRLGQKVGKGWYDYPDPKDRKKAVHSMEMSRLIEKHRVRFGACDMTDERIVQRVLYPLVNEGFKCLEEGIASSPSDIDVVYLYGYGFPVWRGGPMHWADCQVGLPNLLRVLQDFSREFPTTEHYVPSKLLEECVQLGVTVEDHYRRQQMKEGSPKSSRL